MRATIVTLLGLAVLVCGSEDARMTRVDSVEPQGGLVVGGTMVTVRGANLEMVNTCKFGNEQVPVMYADPDGSNVVCKSPEQNSPTIVPVSVSLSSGLNADFVPTSPSNKTLYGYYDVPRIFRLVPSNGPATGGKDVKLQVDKTFLAGIPAKSACMFGKKIAPVKSHVCAADVCYVTCQSPQACVEVDTDNEDCKTHSVRVSLSLNGQDYTTDPKETIEYTYENAWTFPAM